MTALGKAQHERVLRGFFGDDGRLCAIPGRHAKLLVVLDRLVQGFEPGRSYPESAVSARPRAVPP